MTAVWGAITRWLMGSGFKVMTWTAIAGAVLAVLLGAREAGRSAERIETLRRQLEGARQRAKIDADVRSLDDDRLDDGLRHTSRRSRLR